MMSDSSSVRMAVILAFALVVSSGCGSSQLAVVRPKRCSQTLAKDSLRRPVASWQVLGPLVALWQRRPLGRCHSSQLVRLCPGRPS